MYLTMCYTHCFSFFAVISSVFGKERNTCGLDLNVNYFHVN